MLSFEDNIHCKIVLKITYTTLSIPVLQTLRQYLRNTPISWSTFRRTTYR